MKGIPTTAKKTANAESKISFLLIQLQCQIKKLFLVILRQKIGRRRTAKETAASNNTNKPKKT